MPDLLKCPHCHGDIPKGARVCRGCQAEVQYGAPWWANIGALLVGAVTWANMMSWSPTMALVSGIAVAVVLLFAAAKLFSNRINVKRLYRT
jgi:uncharacterized protein YdhG (YjbR/CyaY superfamily)